MKTGSICFGTIVCLCYVSGLQASSPSQDMKLEDDSSTSEKQPPLASPLQTAPPVAPSRTQGEWKWGDSLPPCQEVIDHHKSMKPTGIILKLPIRNLK